MTMHAPGVVCIAHGLRGRWISQDNGKLVVIIERRHFSRRYGQFWLVRAYDMQDWLHVFSIAEGNHLAKTVAAPQRNLIPLGPEDTFLTPEPKEIEMSNEIEIEQVPLVTGGVNVRVFCQAGMGPNAGQLMLTAQVYPLPDGDDELMLKLTEGIRDAVSKVASEHGLTTGEVAELLPPKGTVQ